MAEAHRRLDRRRRREPDARHPKLLIPKPGKGTIVNGKTGKTRNLLSSQD